MLPYLLLLIDGNDDDSKSYNVFTGKKVKSLSITQKYIKLNPVVPVCGDMSMTLCYVLQYTRHFDSVSMGASWGFNTNDARVVADHSLLTHWRAIRQLHGELSIKLSASLNRLRV